MGKIGMAAVLTLALGVAGWAQKYDGPEPPKADIPYLLHAHNLIETELGEAQEVDRKNETANIVAGASSPVRTPLAEPIFIFESDQIDVEDMTLWQMDVVKGNRELAIPNDPKRRINRGPRPVHLMVREVGKGVYWLEANQYLENGEYCLSPQGSQKVFCFQIY